MLKSTSVIIPKSDKTININMDWQELTRTDYMVNKNNAKRKSNENENDSPNSKNLNMSDLNFSFA